MRYLPNVQPRVKVWLLFSAAVAPPILLHAGYGEWSNVSWALLGMVAALCGAGTVALGLHAAGFRRVLGGFLALNGLVAVFLAGYSNAFSDAPSLYSLLNTASEGLKVLPAWVLFLPWLMVIMYSLSLGAGFWLIPRTLPVSRRAPMALLGAWLLVQALALGLIRPDPLFSAPRHRRVLGFWVTSLADGVRAFRAWDDRVLVRDVEKDILRKPPVQLGRAEPVMERVLVLQLESMDLKVLGRRYQGRPILPFLDRLSAMVPPMALEPNHGGPSGSSGAEFQLLTGLRPVSPKPAFTLNRMDWRRHGLPWVLRERGFTFLAFHGNDGSYWNRRKPFLEAGVQRFYERRDILQVPDTHWGASDRAVFDRMLEVLKATPGPLVVFAITMTSHTPFDYAPPVLTRERDLLPRFYNSLHYLDGELGHFMKALPADESWTVILYGDHASRVQVDGYDSLVGGKERVPAWFFTWKGGEAIPLRFLDLPDGLRTSGQLELLAIHGFLLRNLRPDAAAGR